MLLPPLRLVETHRYAEAAKLMSATEQAAVIEMLAYKPPCGQLIPDTGGVRKVRVPLQGRGKRGGAWVVSYFHSAPI